MAERSTTLLKRYIRTAAGGELAAYCDRDLLRRFADAGDQAAFATLFRRHANMVLGVCRRVLPGEQDAEDACHAAFLLLSRKARSGRWQPSVANWLYLTARRVARNARVSADRRVRREKSVAVPEAVQPVDRMTGRELLAVLDEELDKLPRRYREPLVLCYLEGLTRDEAAARLGVPPNTLKGQLDRGRKRLGGALARRGCTAGAGLLAIAATSRARASSPRLVERVLATTAGSPSAAVAKLAEGVAMNAFGKAKLIALAALTGALFMGVRIGSGQPAVSGQSPEKAMPANSAAGSGKTTNAPKFAVERGKEIALTGRVLGPDGKAFAGAKLLAVSNGELPNEVGVSGEDGRFAVSVPAGRQHTYLVAQAGGYGLGFFPLSEPDTREVELRLVKDHPIRGRVVDTQGKPVSGVSVRVTLISVYANDSLDPFLVAFKKRDPYSRVSLGVKDLYAASGGRFVAPVAATTDAEGRFTVRGQGVERFVVLNLSGSGIASVDCRVVNRSGFDPEPYNEASRNNIPKGQERYTELQLLNGPDFTVVTEAEKPIRGVVTDADTGKGRPGVPVRLMNYGDALVYPVLMAITDAAGRYEIHGARKGKEYVVTITDEVDTGYLLSGEARAADTPGYEPVSIDIPTAKGVLITGRVIDRSTGAVLPARERSCVYIAVLAGNPFAKKYLLTDRGPGIVSRAFTAEDGTFRLVAIPGPVILMGGPERTELRSRYKQALSDPNYPNYFPKTPIPGTFAIFGGPFELIQGNWCKVLDIKPGTAEVNQDILLEPATAVALRMRDPAGKPLTGVLTLGTWTRDWYEPLSCTTDTCRVYEPHSGKRLLVLFEPVRNLAAVLKWSQKDQLPAEVTLRPCGSLQGRLCDENGKPLAGVAVDLAYKDRPADGIHKIARKFRQTVTGADGSFSLEPVLPDVPFELTLRRDRKRFTPATKPATPLSVALGETKDLGDVTVLAKGEN
jgi:RNA polymerase sigma factor (sigma-70 family)